MILIILDFTICFGNKFRQKSTIAALQKNSTLARSVNQTSRSLIVPAAAFETTDRMYGNAAEKPVFEASKLSA